MTASFLLAMLLLQTPAPRPAGTVISGRILFADGMPVTGVLVAPVPVPEAGKPATPAPGRISFTDPSGGFRLQNLAAAIPASAGTARYGYYSLPDGVIRYSTLDMLAPPRQNGNPVQ